MEIPLHKMPYAITLVSRFAYTCLMRKPIKILRIITRLNIGGPAIHASLLSQELRSIGALPVENILMHGAIEGDEGNMEYLLNPDKVKIIVIPQLKQKIRPVSDLVTFFKIYKQIKKIRPSIVHTHMAKAGFLGRLAAWLLKVPVIIHTYHGHTFSRYFSRLFERIQKRIERFLNKRSTAVITLSPALKQELTQQYKVVPESLCRVIPLGFHLEKFKSLPKDKKGLRNQLGLPDNKILIGTIGRMVPIKNLVLLLKGVNQLQEEQKRNLHLLFVGEGLEEAQLKDYAQKNNMEGMVSFFGWQRDILPFYQALDYFVLTSLNEGTPVTVIEAMASGVPVLASAVGGVPDLLGEVTLQQENQVLLAERGILFSPNELSLSKALEYCLTNSSLFSEIIPRARHYVDNTFSGERLVKDMGELYQALLPV